MTPGPSPGDPRADLQATVEHYARQALRTPEDRTRAVSLAAANVHAPVQRALAELGAVTMWTDEDIADVSCIYEVVGPEPERAVVYVSTVTPYAAVVVVHGGRYARFAEREGTDWPAGVVQCLRARGFVVLPEAVCRAKQPTRHLREEPPLSYFEVLFQDEFGPPEDWFWADDPDRVE